MRQGLHNNRGMRGPYIHEVVQPIAPCVTITAYKTFLSPEKAREPVVSETFEKLYTPLLKDVFNMKAQEMLAAGADVFSSTRAYADQGKPEFVLACLLLIDLPDDEKRQLFDHAYD